jgi:hypothetical protein
MPLPTSHVFHRRFQPIIRPQDSKARPTNDTDDVERALQRLRAIGFHREAAMAIPRAEHRDWLNCLIDEGWTRSDADEKRGEVERHARIWSDGTTSNRILGSLRTR